MINFSPLRTKRLSIRLKELSIGDAIRLVAIPEHMNESAMTEFIAKVIDSAEPQGNFHVKNPLKMTVQERSLIVAHYIAHVNEAGDPDFQLGGGRYSDFLIGVDVPEFPIEVGEVGEDIWSISPLFGGAAEAIEQLHGEIPNMSGRYHWLTGCIAAQLTLKTETPPDHADAFSDYVQWLKNKMTVLSNYPESQFVELLGLFLAGNKKIEHLFQTEVDDFGIVVLPKSQEAGASKLSPVRFPVCSCISDIAKRLAGKP
ncbi:hypothetical protein [Undibacterium crateris]|uniref:hypothetical protein n=1 Tax=Undibacterium crateris TaxID=2528175 RepID=UPI001389C948|nr:hypothetical protein [Undibacterium crateris]NDI85051.1 hypothetical protein [Undibacterium crateris]